MFYFSGTGNARNVARWMVEAWQEDHRQAELIDLSKTDARAIQIDADDEIGLASPTHVSFLCLRTRAPWPEPFVWF
jgi:flavodoxin